jgi:hypothetical protein
MDTDAHGSDSDLTEAVMSAAFEIASEIKEKGIDAEPTPITLQIPN